MSRRLAAAAGGLILISFASRALAWSRFKSGCDGCHDFRQDSYIPAGGGPAWPASLHDVHSQAGYMEASCNLCHRDNDGGNPYLAWSQGVGSAPQVGCLGCHGQPADGFQSPAGLMRVHDSSGVGCYGCHLPGNYGPPFPEFVKPVYYGLPYSNVDSPCNDDAETSEDMSGDGVGLDNDGDGLRDAADPNCGVQSCGDGVVQAGEICDLDDLWGNDCTTVDPIFGSGTLGCLADCSGFDTSGCEIQPRCGDGEVQGEEICDGSDLGGMDCASLGQGLTGGTLGCLADCSGFDTSGCSGSNLCGNNVLDPGETCDPPSTCPVFCEDPDPCVEGALVGSPSTCDATCLFQPVTVCEDEDGCCAQGCTEDMDSDCGAASQKASKGCKTGGAPVPLSKGASILVVLALFGLLIPSRKAKKLPRK